MTDGNYYKKKTKKLFFISERLLRSLKIYNIPKSHPLLIVCAIPFKFNFYQALLPQKKARIKQIALYGLLIMLFINYQLNGKYQLPAIKLAWAVAAPP